MTGLPKLDRELGGALTPGQHVLHAGPGAGKTALALQIAATCGVPALYVTCEMSPLELLRRVTARVTGVFLGRLRSGELTPAESLRLAQQAVAAAPDLVLADATRAFATPTWIEEVARITRRDVRDVLIAIDSVHSWADGAAGEATEYERLGWALSALRTLAGTLNCAILAIAERNRASIQNGGLSAGAGSRKFEYGGESVWDLSQEKEAVADTWGQVAVTLSLVKNRNGAPGRKIPLKFNGPLQRFSEA